MRIVSSGHDTGDKGQTAGGHLISPRGFHPGRGEEGGGRSVCSL